ncbi:MAG: hypothetical protein ACKVQA_15540 [Burkholderiales bacterium]
MLIFDRQLKCCPARLGDRAEGGRKAIGKEGNQQALTGSLASSTATAQIGIPTVQSTLKAQTSYTISVALGDELSRYAQGERVE